MPLAEGAPARLAPSASPVRSLEHRALEDQGRRHEVHPVAGEIGAAFGLIPFGLHRRVYTFVGTIVNTSRPGHGEIP
jgi:hypothetical protein